MALKKEVTRTEEKTSHKEFSDQATLSAHQLIKSISYVPVEKAGNTALSLSFMIHLLSMHSAKDDYSIVRNIPFLVGPPGTGKTYFAEVLASNVIANLAAILRNDEQASDIAQLLDEARSSGLIPESDFRTIEKVVSHFNNKAMEKLISEVLIKYNEATAKGKEKLSRSFYAFILDLYSNREVGIPTSVEVSTTIFPSQETASDFILSETYVVGGSDIISRTASSTLLELLARSTHTNVVLVLDELSETLKSDMDKRPKNIHLFLDSYINGKPYPFSISEENLTQETREAFATLKEEGLLLDQGNGRYSIIIPKNFTLFATGNERSDYAPVGFTESTWERLTPYTTTYPPVSVMELFLDKKLSLLLGALDDLKGAGEKSSIIEGTKENLVHFVNDLKQKYSKLYNEYINNPQDFQARMLPSYRSFDGMLKAFLSYAFLSKELQDKTEDLKSKGISFSITDYQTEPSFDTGQAALLPKEREFTFPTQQEFASFLLSMLEMQTYIKVGSFTEVSERRGAEETELRLEEKLSSLLSATIGPKTEDTITLKLGDNTFYYSYPYVLYLLYNLSSSLSGQKFFLLTGKTQEGKSTMVDSVLVPILKAFPYALGDKFQYKNVSYVALADADEVSLISTRVETPEGTSLKEPALLKIVKEAQQNKDTLYVVLIDEIDSLQFSQHLNHIMTRDSIEVEGNLYDVSNIVLFGTSNISATMLDNFISRAVLPLIFVRDVGEPTVHGLDGRSLTAVKDFLFSVFGESDAMSTFQQMVGGNFSNTLSSLDFDDVIKIVKNLNMKSSNIKNMYENFGMDEATDYIESQFEEELANKKEVLSKRRGGV